MQAVSQKNTIETPTIYRILFAISFGHFLNDSMQAVYAICKSGGLRLR